MSRLSPRIVTRGLVNSCELCERNTADAGGGGFGEGRPTLITRVWGRSLAPDKVVESRRAAIATYKAGCAGKKEIRYVARDGKPILITGSPGSRTIINTVLCIAVNVIDYGMDIRGAVGLGLFLESQGVTAVHLGVDFVLLFEIEVHGFGLEVDQRQPTAPDYARWRARVKHLPRRPLDCRDR